MDSLFNVVKKGYDQDEVDNYVQTLEALIKSYKDKDDTIKNAIINAQIAADNIIKNAEIEGDRIKKRAIRLMAEIQTSIVSQKKIARDFQDEYNKLTTKYLHNIGNSEIEKLLGKIAELEDYITTMQKTHGDGLPAVGASSPVPQDMGVTRVAPVVQPSGLTLPPLPMPTPMPATMPVSTSPSAHMPASVPPQVPSHTQTPAPMQTSMPPQHTPISAPPPVPVRPTASVQTKQNAADDSDTVALVAELLARDSKQK